MDEFLRDIHTTIFKQWILHQKYPNYQVQLDKDDENIIMISTEYGQGKVIFNEHNIIELEVMNISTQEVEFYLHFQLNTMNHTLKLYEEMLESLNSLIEQPIIKVLLSCSGGLTTSYFAYKINEAAEILKLNIHVEAIGYTQLYDVGNQYDVIMLAPQISYMHAKIQEILKDQVVIEIPTQAFAKYDVSKVVSIIKEAVEQKKQAPVLLKKPLTIQSNIKCQTKILSLAIIRNSNRVHIPYRLYGPNNTIILDNEIIKPELTIQDIIDVINTVLVHYEDTEIIGITIPGIINKNIIKSAHINGLEIIDTDLITCHFHQKIIFANDVNAAAVGYYASQSQYSSLSLLFQPINFGAGAGMVIDGNLVVGYNNLAGEVQYFPMNLSDEHLVLSKTPEGTLELVSKTILTIMGVISPEAIILYCTLITDIDELKREIAKYIPSEYIPDIIKVESLNEYCLLGQMILCAQSL